jgi:hypothetical protein
MSPRSSATTANLLARRGKEIFMARRVRIDW